jgi:hypothetical protein
MCFHEPQHEKDGAEEGESECRRTRGRDERWVRPGVADVAVDLLDVPYRTIMRELVLFRSW